MADPSNGPGFDEQSQAVAKRFLRNVLLIDDAAHMEPTEHGRRNRQAPVKTPDVSDIEGELPEADPGTAGTDSLDAAQLVRDFAELGLMCAPLVPAVDKAEDGKRIREQCVHRGESRRHPGVGLVDERQQQLAKTPIGSESAPATAIRRSKGWWQITINCRLHGRN